MKCGLGGRVPKSHGGAEGADGGGVYPQDREV